MDVAKKIFVIGAGRSGRAIAREIGRKPLFGCVAAFLDDDLSLSGKSVEGVPVFTPISALGVLQHSADDSAYIAMPSAGKKRIREVFGELCRAGFSKSNIRIVPSVSQVVDGEVHLIQTREIDPLDILGRDAITVSLKRDLAYLKGGRVLVTGAGGSVGSEISRQLLSAGVERLYLFGRGENSIYEIDRELRLLQREGVGVKTVVVPVIGDVANFEYMKWLLPKMSADAIFHCAANKHVPLGEENPVAAIENNVFGTKSLFDAAALAGAGKIVLVSTDKAVCPVSVYGASKFLCEKLALDAAAKARPGQSFMFVRFGNVLGSRGSFLPLFMQQIKSGGPVTVTDPEMRRHFITIPEACSLVLKAGGLGENGRSYLLEMGEPLRIADIAEQLIRFSGHSLDEIAIKFVGARKGERLDEPLWTESENPVPCEDGKMLSISPSPLAGLGELIESLRPICFFDGSAPEKFRNKTLLLDILRKNAILPR